MPLLRRLRTAVGVFRERGAGGVFDVWRETLDDSWWMGKLVELRGNEVTIDGLRFSVDSPEIGTAVKTRFLFGRYEEPERDAMRRFLDPALPVVELGGSVGVVACLTNRRLADPSRHVVVEANPGLIPLLERNRDRHGRAFTVLNRALAYGADEVSFFLSPYFLGSRTRPHHKAHLRAAEREIRVPATTLAAVLDAHGFDRCTLVCDIEGSERELIANEGETLRQRVATFMLETHEYFLGADAVRDMVARVEALGFRRLYERDGTMAFANAALGGAASP